MKVELIESNVGYYVLRANEGYLRIIAGWEDYHDDGSVGLHVSVSFSTNAIGEQTTRKPTDKEMVEVAKFFYCCRKFEEDNMINRKDERFIRHLWELPTTEE